MRTFLALALVASSVSLFADPHFDTDEFPAQAEIVSPIRVDSKGDMAYGKIIVNDYDTPASVEMVLDPIVGPGPGEKLAAGLPTFNATLKNFVQCERFKLNPGAVTPAIFVYTATQNANVKVTVDPTVKLVGGHGGDVTLTTKSSPLQTGSFLPDVKGVVPIPGVIDQHVFAVVGKIDIPAKCLGVKVGIINVKVEYI